jgi:cation transport ATPase
VGSSQRRSSHPLALAILDKANEDGIDAPAATDAKALGGKGVTAIVEGVKGMLDRHEPREVRLRKIQIS